MQGLHDLVLFNFNEGSCKDFVQELARQRLSSLDLSWSSHNFCDFTILASVAVHLLHQRKHFCLALPINVGGPYMATGWQCSRVASNKASNKKLASSIFGCFGTYVFLALEHIDPQLRTGGCGEESKGKKRVFCAKISSLSFHCVYIDEKCRQKEHQK